MARRKRNKQPNLPEATLERAREQAGLPAETDAAEEVEEVETTAAAAPVREKPKSPVSRTGRRVSAAKLEQSRKRGDMDQEMVEYMLEHPTKVVTEGELRAEYGHVLYDLRNMFLLAGVLIAVMIVIAQFI
jgi:hypothetical protein